MPIIDRPNALAAATLENGIVAVSSELSRSKSLVVTDVADSTVDGQNARDRRD
jgi:hypothetical protein